MNRRIAFLLLFFLPSGLPAQRFDFFAEELEFGIDSVYFSVKGYYHFRNPSGKDLKVTIVYPVTAVAGHTPFDTILAADTADLRQPLSVKIRDTIALIPLHLPPYSEKCYLIWYRQRHNGSEARYILTTTRYWGKPLQNATYRLLTGSAVRVDTVSIPPDRKDDFGDATLLTWEKRNFMPEADLIFRFTIQRQPVSGK